MKEGSTTPGPRTATSLSLQKQNSKTPSDLAGAALRRALLHAIRALRSPERVLAGEESPCDSRVARGAIGRLGRRLTDCNLPRAALHETPSARGAACLGLGAHGGLAICFAHEHVGCIRKRGSQDELDQSISCRVLILRACGRHTRGPLSFSTASRDAISVSTSRRRATERFAQVERRRRPRDRVAC